MVELGAGLATAVSATSPTIVRDGFALRMGTGAAGFGLGLATGWAVDSAAQRIDDRTGLERWEVHALTAAAGIGALLATNHIVRLGTAAALTRTAGKGLATVGVVGTAVDATTPGTDRDTPDFLDRHRWPIVGVTVAAVGVGAALLAKKFVPVMHNAGSIGALLPGEDAVGEALGETIPRSKQTGFGRLFLRNRTPGFDSVRAYIPLELDGLEMHERNAKGVESLVNQGGTDKNKVDKIVVHVTTGTGGSNPAPIGFDEEASGGRTAWIAFQYSDKASIFSLSRTQDGVDQFVDLVKQIRAEINRQYPNGGGPEIYAAATSLGAMVIENAIHQSGEELFGAAGGLKRAVHLGQPEEMSEMTVTDLPDEQIGRYHNLDDIRALTPAAVNGMKVMEYAHPEDPVRTMSMRYAYTDPPFARERPRPSWVPTWYRSTPVISWFRHGMDTAQAIDKGTGVTVTNVGHDYRNDMYEFVNKAFDHNLPDDQVTAIGQRTATRASEIAREVRRQAGLGNGPPNPPNP
jgi:hypothetical protein